MVLYGEVSIPGPTRKQPTMPGLFQNVHFQEFQVTLKTSIWFCFKKWAHSILKILEEAKKCFKNEPRRHPATEAHGRFVRVLPLRAANWTTKGSHSAHFELDLKPFWTPKTFRWADWKSPGIRLPLPIRQDYPSPLISTPFPCISTPPIKIFASTCLGRVVCNSRKP